ncbi:uncharacterized protein DDB_G0285291-like [Daphnia carinata]|uniref:uncharacterized protein DDB_G0285291-like n=1 Tax=Daphnia carinata TaxID=120202 RepID=UPI00257ED765|nr:uncharacterized protein DDB_G0285291-like [Daphnia carinata]
MSAISVAGAIVASTLSGITADWGFYHYDYPMCIARLGLEWTLMSISVLAIMNSITLVSLASVPLCCSGRKKGQQGSTKVTIGVGSNQQPMYYQPQPMYVVAQQQPNVQVVHAGQQNPQQIQYPQQQQVQFLPNSQVVYVPQQQQQPQLLQQQYPQQQHTQKAPAAKQQPQAPVVHQQQPQQNQTSPYEELNVQLHAVENTTPTV